MNDINVLEGWLKVPGLFGASKRWAILTTSALLVYKDDDCSDLKCELNLSDYKKVDQSTEKVAWFELSDPFSQDKRRFIAPTEREMNIWTNAIKNRSQISHLIHQEDRTHLSSPSHNITIANNNDDLKHNNDDELLPSIHASMIPPKIQRNSTFDSNHSTDHQRSPSQSQWQYVHILNQKISALENQLLVKDEHIQWQKSEIESSKITTEQLHADILEKNASIKNKEDTIQNMEHSMQEQSDKLISSEASNLSYKDQLKQSKTDCEAKEKTISDEQKAKAKLSASLQTSRRIVKEKDDTIGELNRKMATQITTIKEQKKDIKQLKCKSQAETGRIVVLEAESARMLQKEGGDEIRNKLLEGKKGWLTFITVVIAMCSLFSSLGLSKWFRTSDTWNGRIAMGTSIFSLALTTLKFGLSYSTFDKHYHNNEGLERENQRMSKNKKSHQFLMKAIYVTVSTINDCIFDILMGIAAITGEPYTYGTFGILLAATWFGALEEFGELVVEIFFDTDECSCLCCTPVKSYSGLLLWSYAESVVGVYLLTTYDNDILKYVGIGLELVLGGFILLSLHQFYHWTKQYSGFEENAAHNIEMGQR